jgi:arabinosaccharide transport system substrate-binding protein
MIDRFPYGRAPFWLTVVALGSLVLVLGTRQWRSEKKADLVLAFFASSHMPAYRAITPEFERKHGVKVALQLVHQRALKERLQNAMLAGTEVPDLVELIEGTMSFFTRGPLEDVGWLDLTERLEVEGYRARLVESRLSLWSSRGHVFALPHDVHPIMLTYRADLVESLGIDVARLTTWDEFVRVGRRIVKDLDGDGVPDRYMLDLPMSGGWGLNSLLLQRGVGLFDAQGRVTFNRPATVDTIVWYLRQTRGKERIAYECGMGQALTKAMMDGLALFYIAPDWRSYRIQDESPKLKGKLRLMPLPAWEPGGRRTSVFGGTGLAINRRTKDPELAWEYAKFLYFNTAELGRRFALTYIIPPFADAWDLPELQAPNEFYSGQRLGAEYAALARETPPVWSAAESLLAQRKLDQASQRAAIYFAQNGESGLREYIQQELAVSEAYVKRAHSRNVLARR